MLEQPLKNAGIQGLVVDGKYARAQRGAIVGAVREPRNLGIDVAGPVHRFASPRQSTSRFRCLSNDADSQPGTAGLEDRGHPVHSPCARPVTSVPCPTAPDPLTLSHRCARMEEVALRPAE